MDTLKDSENFPLDEASIQILAEVNQRLEAINAEGQKLRQMAEGALLLFLRQHKLEGNWQVAPNGKELVKQAATEVRT